IAEHQSGLHYPARQQDKKLPGPAQALEIQEGEQQKQATPDKHGNPQMPGQHRLHVQPVGLLGVAVRELSPRQGNRVGLGGITFGGITHWSSLSSFKPYSTTDVATERPGPPPAASRPGSRNNGT